MRRSKPHTKGGGKPYTERYMEAFIPQETLAAGISFINNLDTFLLTMAMTALGAETSIDKFKQAGAKPFLLAGGLYVWLVLGGYFLSKTLV